MVKPAASLADYSCCCDLGVLTIWEPPRVADAAISASSDRTLDLSGADARASARNLFLTGFLILFLELACIRWFATTVIFLQFFTNVILLSSFLGMSCGCMAARQPRDWLGAFPFVAFWTVFAAPIQPPVM